MEITIIGIAGCSRCEAVMSQLDYEGQVYLYEDFQKLDLKRKRIISREFRNADGSIDFPVILVNEELCD